MAGADVMAMYRARERLAGADACLALMAAACLQTGGTRFADALHESGGIEVCTLDAGAVRLHRVGIAHNVMPTVQTSSSVIFLTPRIAEVFT